MPHVCAPRRYLNSSHTSFEEVCKAFLAEITLMTQGELPAVVHIVRRVRARIGHENSLIVDAHLMGGVRGI